jgi:hypothetical protein
MLSAQVPTPLRNELERVAREHDRSMSAEVRLALRQHLQDPGGGFSSSHRSDVDGGPREGGSPSPPSSASGQL